MLQLFAEIADTTIGDCKEVVGMLTRMIPEATRNRTQARWLLYCIQGSILGSTAREVIVAIWTICSRLPSKPGICLRMIPRLMTLLNQNRGFTAEVMRAVKDDSDHPLLDVVRWLHSKFTVIIARVVSMLCGSLTFSLPHTLQESSPAASGWIHCTLLKGGISAGVIPELKVILDATLLRRDEKSVRSPLLSPMLAQDNGIGMDSEAVAFLKEIQDDTGLGAKLLAAIRNTFRPMLLPRSVKIASEPVCRSAFAAILKHTRMVLPASHLSQLLYVKNIPPSDAKCKLVFGILCEWWNRVKRIKYEMGKKKGEGGDLVKLTHEWTQRLRLLLSLEPSPAVRIIPFFECLTPMASPRAGFEDTEDE
eukprot:1251515-Amorphochlora_amoeboformis.AAC.1